VAHERLTRPYQRLAYLGMLLCAVLLVVGSLAAIFEDAPVVRIYGGLTSVMAVIVGTAIARRLWPRKPVADTMN
jgi:disulfide bond formation protein DsbB